MIVAIQWASRSLRDKSPVLTPLLKSFLRSVVKTLLPEPEAKDWVAQAGAFPSTLSVRICDDIEMRAVHKRLRGLDRTTDVLSFPSLEWGSGAWLEEPTLGDLLVSLECVERAARRVGRTSEEELFEVLIHGVLHLFGLDHVNVTRGRAVRMRQLQKKLLRAMKRSHDLRKSQRHQRTSRGSRTKA
jgi:probable rRNA maturation factor